MLNILQESAFKLIDFTLASLIPFLIGIGVGRNSRKTPKAK